ncbi:hypothetical protein LSAT2_032052 [Lamellibrachia satsuma]|nr:hypothetical protein LSAT2_032052 [Lamellibrachia satsuma]
MVGVGWLYPSRDTVGVGWLYPDAADIHPSTWVGNVTSLENGYLSPDRDGVPNILTLDAANGAGLTATQVSPALIVDTSAPLDGTVSCPEFVQGGDSLECSWSGFTDMSRMFVATVCVLCSVRGDSLECSWSGFIENESGVEFYKFGVGRVEGDDSMYEFHRVEACVNSHKAIGLKNGGLKHQETYYVTVSAVNKVGLTTTAFSRPLLVDNTPPQGGLVIELPDTCITSVNTAVDTDTNTTQQEAAAAFTRKDVICQRALTQVVVAWQPFEDPETEVIRYQVALGSTPGGTQVHPFEDVSPGALSAVIRHVDLSRQRRVFVTVKGYNAAGLHSTTTSNGVYLSRISAGLEPLGASYVYDGNDVSTDMEFQDHNDGLSAHWDVSGDPCPIEKFEWAIHKFDGTVVLNMTQLPADARHAEADELALKDGESYFVVLRVTNKLGFVYTVHSNGVTVKLEPLLPGNVRDGDIVGTDLNYQPSVTSLSANWDGFGKPKNDDSGPVISKVSSVDATIGEHLKIKHYKVAVSTDHRFHNTRNNIRPFINIGLNMSWMFSDLYLIAHTSIYYVTVRTYSESSSMFYGTSNCIKVGYGKHVVSAGSLELSKYSSSATHLSFSWSGFKFLLPVKMYYWGMSTSEAALASLSCHLLVHREEDGSVVHNSNYTQLFDIHPLTSVNLDTYVQVTDLRLVQGKTYQVVIIAVDESGGCVETSDSVTVDTTPPLGSQIGVGPESDMKLLYASSRDTLTAWWSGFTDPESGIKTFNIRLLSGDSCLIHGVDNLTTLVDWTELSANSSSYDFTHLSLQESVVYFIDLQATNGADLELHNLSRPVLLDAASPIGGTIKHGDNFKEGATYQGSTTEIKGVFLYVPSASETGCSQQIYRMTGPDSHWMPLVHKYLHDFQQEKQDGVAFQDYQLGYTGEGLSVTLRRDVQKARMLSGALQADADVESGGTYSFDIQAASGALRAVTSVVFFDGPKGVFVDYTPVFLDGDTSRLADSGMRSNGLRIVDTGLPGDTAFNIPEDEMHKGRGFGFQIFPNASYKGQSSDWVVLWSAKLNKTSHTISQLKFDPTEETHTYKLVINEDTSMFDEENWEFKLYIDERQQALLVGTTVSQDTCVTLGFLPRPLSCVVLEPHSKEALTQ